MLTMNVTLVNLSNLKNIEDGESFISSSENSKLRFLTFVLTIPGLLWNGVLLVCFYRNKNAIWIKDTKNMISNVFSDFVLSISNTFLLAITVIPEGKQWPLEICYIKNYLYITLQCVSLNHILALCIDRFRIALNVRNLQRSGMSPYKRSVAIWVCTSVIGLVPLFIQTSEHQERQKECTSETVALGLSPRLVLIFHTVMTLAPWFITNVLFVVTSVILWRKIRTVQPVQYPIQQTDNTTEMRSCNRRTGDLAAVNNIRYIPQPNGQGTVNGIRGTNANSQQRRTKNNVMVTIGLLIIVFNISMWPAVVCLIGYQLSEPFELEGKYYIFLFMNQTLNPIIYSFRLARLRQALKEFLGSCFSRG